MHLPNPLIPGFNPDPSVVRVGDDYYICTSSFEYLPGLPIYHSKDFIHWDLIGHVVTTEHQLASANIPTNGGAWAPTIRNHDGVFYVVVTDAMGRGTLVFTATDPAGKWSDGVVTNISGIDPDIFWDEDGTCYATFSGLQLSGNEFGKHLGIQQAKIDLATGQLLEEPRSIWSGVGGMFPEAPHIYKIDDWYYLFIAEGGTERGHGESVARSRSLAGPYESGPNNPFLSARSTIRPIQNTGHGDLVQLVSGDWVMVLLGMRTRGQTRSFSSLGRETFATNIAWVDGWPVAEPVHPSDLVPAPEFVEDFSGSELSQEFIAIRRLPAAVSALKADGLQIRGDGSTMSDLRPAFVGRRLRRHDGILKAELSVNGVGGISIRYDEVSHYEIEIANGKIIARSNLARVVHEVAENNYSADSKTTLYMEFIPSKNEFNIDGQSCDFIRLGYFDNHGNRNQVAEFDGRFLSAEVACSFTGRVVGVYSSEGEVVLHKYSETSH
ncbi:MAG: family 43 glycosylhydrolase [Micrococcales bacterium]